MKKIDSNFAIQYRGKLKDYNLNKYTHSYDNGYWEASGRQINDSNRFPFDDVNLISEYQNTIEIPDELLDVERHLDRVNRYRNDIEKDRKFNETDDISSVLNADVEKFYWGDNDNPIPDDFYPVQGIFEVQSDDDFTVQTFHRLPDGSVWTRSYDRKTDTWTEWASEVPSILLPDSTAATYISEYNEYREPSHVGERGIAYTESGDTGFSPINNHKFDELENNHAPRQFYQMPIKTKTNGQDESLNIFNHYHKFNGTLTDIEVLQYINDKALNYLSMRRAKNEREESSEYPMIGGAKLNIPNFWTLDEINKFIKQRKDGFYTLKKKGLITKPMTIASRFYIKDDLPITHLQTVWTVDGNPFSLNDLNQGTWLKKDKEKLSIMPKINTNNYHSSYGGKAFNDMNKFTYMNIFGSSTIDYMTDEEVMNSYLNPDRNNLKSNRYGARWKSYHKPMIKEDGVLKGIVSTVNELFGFKYGEPSNIIGGRTGIPEYRFEIPNTRKMFDKIGTYIDDDSSYEDYTELVSAIILKVNRVNEDESKEEFFTGTEYIYIQVDEYFEEKIFPTTVYGSVFRNGDFKERGLKVTYRKGENDMDYIYVYAVEDKEYAFRYEVIIEQ